MVQFKCYSCGGLVENIPYCGVCEIALPNCCKVNGYKCSDCKQSPYCAHSEFNKNHTVVVNGVRTYYTKEQLKRKSKTTFSKFNVKTIHYGEDADLLNDFDNNKAAQILKIVHSGINRKKSKASGKSKFKMAQRLNIYKRDGFKCLKCGSTDNLTLDHIKPKSKGGKNLNSNLQTLCYGCNQEKRSDVVDYRGRTGLYLSYDSIAF